MLGGCGGQDEHAHGVVPHSQRPLADLINPLVITETGLLKPVAYDFDRRFDVGHIEGLSSEALTRYKQQGLPAFRALIGAALGGLQGQQRVLDWFDHCTRLSERQGRIPISAAVE